MQADSAQQQGLYRPEFDHDACGIGALADINGERHHQILDDALSILVNLEHRGGTGLEKNTGDGAGILFQVPHHFFRKEAQKCGQILPAEGDYGVAMLFFPQDDKGVEDARRVFEEGCAEAGVPLLFWREVPVDPHDLGETARACMPTILQAFLGRPDDTPAGDAFERRLYVCRRTIEKKADAEFALRDKIFYVCSMSSRTIVYKGMLVATQMRRFFIDLNDAAVKTAVALVHSRYSTNTTPSWERAHPNRFIIHNGEINTLKGNVNWIRAREPNLYSPVLQHDLERVMPIINREGSDSAILDNVLEFLVMNGRPLTRAASMLLPEPWDHNDSLSEERRAYDAYQSMLMEPWDGPAAIAFTDGRTLGAALDRNGLRPARYYVTRDGRFMLASEVGTIEVRPENILTSGCLGPGQMLEVDFARGRVIYNDELRARYAKEKPYRDWIAEETLTVDALDEPVAATPAEDAEVPAAVRMAKLGYHWDDVDEVVRPMAQQGKPPLASMGIDAPLACLSKKTRSFFDYFYQLFAQVTNPPIDALREHMVTSTTLYLGNHGNLLEDSRTACQLVRLERPLLNEEELDHICAIDRVGFKTRRFRAVYRRDAGEGALQAALKQLAEDVEAAVRDGVNIVVLSDRAGAGEVPVPSLLAVGCVHNHLIRAGVRTFADIVVECGDAVSSHDFAALVGYSASGIYPYNAHACIRDLAARGDLDVTAEQGIANYNKAATAGIVSIMSKMGISTVQSYHSAQIFEAVGFTPEFVNAYFAGTVSRVGGMGVEDVEREQNERYDAALAILKSPAPDQLPTLGLTKWRPLGGEDHLIDPQTVYLLQTACREDSYDTFKEYSARLHRTGRAVRLRDLLDFNASGRTPVALDEVEPALNIVRRFNTGAMSYGSISKEAHECMAIAMNRLHGRSNSGEGGEDPRRETPLANGDSKNSAIKQVASARFGVTSRYLCSAFEIQIKMAQGAKPGEGGHLPGKKVYPWIAEVRQSTPGIGLISPPPHHDIYSIEDLAELIYDLKNANRNANINVKLVSEAGVGTIAAGVAKGGAQVILVSGYDGGTGAAPRTSIKHAGLPWELGIAETHQTLILNGLRTRVRIESDSKLLSGRDVAISCMLGAEEFGFGTTLLMAEGCVMMRVCNLDTCPMGICTQNPELRKNFKGKPEYIINYLTFVAEELREYMAKLGVRTVDELVGRTDLLRVKPAAPGSRAAKLDLDCILHNPAIANSNVHFIKEDSYDFHLENTLDMKVLMKKFKLGSKAPQSVSLNVSNVDRAFGAIFGSEITRKYGNDLPDDVYTVHCTGAGGQSFGAFIPNGLTLELVGDCNDYMGKGLSGGKIIVRPPQGIDFKPEENIITGNVALYGATSGKAFISGVAGERFCVRNSGATAVVEGVGDHGCEYMTGGTVVVLGQTGKNFAAGMTGGIAYVLDENWDFYQRVNKETVSLEPVEHKYDVATLKELIRAHVEATGSPCGKEILDNFSAFLPKFKKVLPYDYDRMLRVIASVEERGLDGEQAQIEAFYAVQKHK